MSARRYKIVEGGLHDKFHQSRSKVQFIGGGFGNGKTAAVCIKALKLCTDYPGCNGLIARSTYPKLNDTIRREFLKWCPREWIKRAPTKDDNTIILKNGSTVNFRYVAQRGKEQEESKSNLLSATYDFIVVDQIEDPEFGHKDFMDLLGRLRGDAEYGGSDPSMPATGPRWFMLTSNPTRNWVFRELVRPLHNYQRGVVDPKLLCEVDQEGQPVHGTDGRPKPIIELFEGSTYENVENVGEDYINTMLSAYTGSMRDRFVYGKWGALAGLIYPQFTESVNVVQHDEMCQYIEQLRISGFVPTVLESYDHGIAVPSCYLLSFVDDDGNVMIVDGFYLAEQSIRGIAENIKDVRWRYRLEDDDCGMVYADPAIFRRGGTGGGRQTGSTVADLLREEGILLQRGANDIAAGINKVQQYLSPLPRHEHPIYGTEPSPFLYVSDKLQWWINEITEYYWRRDTSDDVVDKPVDRNDHAMDATKYLLTPRPRIARFGGRPDQPPSWMYWHEVERAQGTTSLPRHR